MIEMCKGKKMRLFALRNFIQQVMAIRNAEILPVVGGNEPADHVLHARIDNDSGDVINRRALVHNDRIRIHEFGNTLLAEDFL